MANEITIAASLAVANGNLKWSSGSVSYRANQTTRNGPSPDAVTATTGGVAVSFAQLTLPGVVMFTNTDPSSGHYVEIGLYDGTTFRPFAEILPGETYIMRFSRNMLTANSSADVLRLKANTASVVVNVTCFDA